MADWTDITDSQVDPDAPLTSELAYAWRDNVIAMTEGAVGAPRVAWEAMGASPFVGSGFASNQNPLAFTSIGACRVFILHVGFLSNGSNVTIQISTSTDGGSTWSGYANISPAANDTGTIHGFSIINLSSGSYNSLIYTATVGNGTFAAAPTANAVRFRMSSGNGSLKAALLKLGRD